MARQVDMSSDPSFRAVGRTTGTTADLGSITLPTSCPPDIPPRSRIVAVCGVTDFGDQASPKVDGWFLSDFYLFYHLLSPKLVGSTKQIWLTSEEPSYLVSKYTEYAHGDPKQDRRVVLDQGVLEKIQQAGNIRVVPRPDLLERFISTVRDQARIAADFDEHLVLLIFGHGEESSYGVAIGGECDAGDNNVPKLKIEYIQRAIRRNAPVTLFMNSCFSGGWLVQPNINTRQQLNVTGIAACGIEQQTRSWPLSASLGRANGSMIATAILKSIISIDDQEAASDITDQPTYISLAHAIHTSHKKLDTMFEENQIHFSAQDDAWAMQYQARIGLPLEGFKTIWQTLRSIPSGDYQTKSSDHASGTLHRFGTIRSDKIVRYQARRYLSSFPGPDNYASNIAFHNQLISLLTNKKKFNDSQIERIANSLQYRLSLHDQANDLVQVMGLEMPNINDYEVESWKPSTEQRELKSKVWTELVRKSLLDKPYGPHAGWPRYYKPLDYICIALAESRLSWEEMLEKIRIAEEYTQERANQIVSMHHGDEIIADREVVRNRDAFFKVIKDLGHRVRQIVPRNR
jgi:hypothetical protein